MSDERRYTGKVRWFDHEKAYGFIVPAVGGDDVFVHVKAVIQRDPPLQPGDPVEFSIVPGKKPGSKAAGHVVRLAS